MTLDSLLWGIGSVWQSPLQSFDVFFFFLQQYQKSYPVLLHAFACSTVEQSFSLQKYYFKAVKFELEFLLLIEQLLESVSQNDVCIVESAILLVELVVLIYVFFPRSHLLHYGTLH
jgi:hypothetical protein